MWVKVSLISNLFFFINLVSFANYTLVTNQALAPYTVTTCPGSEMVCWPDWNDDGWPDLHLGPKYMFKNNGDGTFTLVDTLGLPPSGTWRASWADADNDGDLDCAMGQWELNATINDTLGGYFYFNDGPPNFTFQHYNYYQNPTNCRATQPVFIDIDRDCGLEIYQATFGNWSPNYGCAPDRLMQDFGLWGIYFDDTFNWIPQLNTGLYYRPVRGAVSCDYDNDFDPDIFVPVYGVAWTENWEDILWQNDGFGHFIDVAEQAGVNIDPHCRYGIGLGSGASWGDYDNDGWFDLVVADIHGWSVLYHNNGDGTFTDVTETSGLPTPVPNTPEEKQWHNTNWADIDNDGDIDLWLNQWYTYQGYTSYVFQNDGPENLGHFTDVTNYIGFFNLTTFMTDWGFALADYDKDGDMDVFYYGGSSFPGKYLYRNDLANGNHWMGIELVGDEITCNRSALNAQIRLHFASDTSGVKQVESNSADEVMNQQSVHFGLGAENQIGEVIVYWPCGRVECFTWEDIGSSVDHYATLIEGTSGAIGVKERRDLFSLEGIKLYPPSPNPFNSSIALRFELSADSELELKIFDISGREVAVLGTEHWALGEHSVVWEAEGMPSGIYIARLSAIGYQLSASGGQSIVQKLLLLK